MRITRTPAVALKLLVAGMIAVIGLTACSNDDDERQTAIEGLEQINTLLDQALEAYRSGDPDTAYGHAQEAGHDIYETSEVEGVVARVAPGINRELDPLVEATIPAAIQNGAPVEEVDQLIARCQELVNDAIQQLSS
jgi:hypothetical protein